MDLPRGAVFEVAPRLLGWTLATSIGGQLTTLRISEVEAYAVDDPASHSFRGPTARNQSMFLAPGHLYVYRIYGQHWCANVVTGPVGTGEAVLLRAGVPITGRAAMVVRRGREDRLSDGPGKLCQALGIDGSFDGELLSGPRVSLESGEPPDVIESTPRVGITKATDRLWRFVAK